MLRGPFCVWGLALEGFGFTGFRYELGFGLLGILEIFDGCIIEFHLFGKPIQAPLVDKRAAQKPALHDPIN